MLMALCLLFPATLGSPDFPPVGKSKGESPGPAPAASPAGFPVVVRLRLPFLIGQCEEHVTGRVEEVMVGYPALRGREVGVRGLGEMRGQREMVVSGTFRMPQPARNPMAYDARDRARREGRIGTITVKAVLEESYSIADRAAASLRGSVRRLIASLPGRDERGVLEAMLLGDRGGLTGHAKSVMVKAGTYHVLAISGLHVGILVFMVSMFVTVLRLGRSGRVGVALFLVFLYVIFTGARPSALRAGALFLVVGVGKLLEYKVDGPNCVCLAGMALLAAFPALAWDLGFRLSFGAVFGMALFMPKFDRPPAGSRAFRLLGKLRSGLLASFTAQILTMPLILWSFGRVSLVSAPANIVVLPAMTLSLAAGVEAAVFAPFLPTLGSVFMRSASLMVSVALRLAGALVDALDPVVFPGRPWAVSLPAYYALVLTVGLMGKRLSLRVKFLLFAAALVVMALRPALDAGGGDGRLRMTFLYVGNGDACVMELPNGETVLVDTGPADSDYSAASGAIIPYLNLRGIGGLEKLVITHPHNDHYGGIPALLDNLDVAEIVVSVTDGEEQYRSAIDRARRKGVIITCPRAGRKWESGGVEFEVVHPGEPGSGIDLSAEAGDPNAWSLVLRVTYGRRSVLMTGDLTPSMQDSLVARGAPLRCDMLKVPHHGHPGETTPAFARAAGAEFGVISVGYKYFGGTDSTTMRLLAEAGTRSFSTLTDGAVCVSTDGASLSVHTCGSNVEITRH
jgi:competence protein ComEC